MAILRKMKERFKKIQQQSAKVGLKIRDKISKGLSRQIGVKGETRESKKEILGAQETVVEKTKFSTPEPFRVFRGTPEDLPYGYGEDRIVLQVRDSWWLHAYWEVTPQIWDTLRERLRDTFLNSKRVLRVYDVSNISFDGKNANSFFDIEVGSDASNWYIDTGGPGRSWCVDFGLRSPNGEFITVVRSNTVTTPLAGPSWITDEEWMVPEDIFARLYGMGFGFGRSSPVGKAWLKKALFSGVLASPGMASMASPVKAIPKERKFWLVVNTELIVYGATEPDAKVTVQGQNIKLRPDGTFSLRFALPDGKQVIPVNAKAADGLEEKTITPIVTKETK